MLLSAVQVTAKEQSVWGVGTADEPALFAASPFADGAYDGESLSAAAVVAEPLLRLRAAHAAAAFAAAQETSGAPAVVDAVGNVHSASQMSS